MCAYINVSGEDSDQSVVVVKVKEERGKFKAQEELHLALFLVRGLT